MHMWLVFSLGCYKWYQSQPGNLVQVQTYWALTRTLGISMGEIVMPQILISVCVFA